MREPHRRRVGLYVGGQRREHAVDRRHGAEEGRPLALDQVEERAGVEPLGDDDAGAGEQRREDADHDAVDVEQRQDQQAAVVGPT